VIHVTESGISWESPLRAQDLADSLCGEFNLFRKEKVCAEREDLKERGSVSYKN